MSMTHKPTYISLFSSAGIGCYGFKLENFNCVATNELLEKRLNVQKYNQKCKYESGYIYGDISLESTKKALYSQVDLWKQYESITRIDVIIATPPCQGMSVANHKKSKTEIIRNSLVIESIKIINKINPRFFIFENVPSFMKTICTDIDGTNKTISEAIEKNLGKKYSYTSRIINFKNYGACSSRQRTLVIGVSKDYADEISPLELYPEITEERTLYEAIGNLKPLKKFGEIDNNDIYHSFRRYPEHMRSWITELKEGQSAFENEDDTKKPHQIINGKLIINKQKNGDKYKRQYWNKVGPCIHTRNDQLASQNTIHPSDDRVFSIRELMIMMTVPQSFKWVETDFEQLNNMSIKQKQIFLKKEEIKIRQSLGEAVPTIIFQAIAKKINKTLQYQLLNIATINKIISNNALKDEDNLINFVKNNPMQLSVATLSKIAELANTSRLNNAAFFTSKTLITEILKSLPISEKDTLKILEPSAGVGNFIPLIIQKFENKNIIIDVLDIDKKNLEIARLLLNNITIPKNCTINYINDDFLLHDFNEKYDYIIGNPPFLKLNSKSKLLNTYKHWAINKSTNNICSFFLDKAVNIGNYVALVLPKFILNTPEFAPTREYLANKAVECIIDFGEKGFPGILVETIAIFVNNLSRPNKTNIFSVSNNQSLLQPQKYIFDKKLPYWIIYRNSEFDFICKKLDFNVFKVFRDRQITTKMLANNGDIRVLKARNISDNGLEILNIAGYDSYISQDIAKNLSVYEYINDDNVYITPNMTYKPRMTKKPKNCLTNGSLAILIPQNNIIPTQKQMNFFSTQEYRDFYQIARNYQTRSLNVDTCSVFFYGLLRETLKENPITENFSEHK